MKLRQTSLSEAGFPQFNKVTRRERFLDEMNKAVPWSKIEALIQPIYPTGTGAGRPPIGLDRMLRLYFLQLWFELSDPAAEDAMYDSQSMRRFVGIDPGRERAPDETTICKFRKLLTEADIGRQMLEVVNKHLASCGHEVRTGTIVDATIIDAPSSTKNEERARDPEMHQTKKGNQWFFGMKGHVGVDSKTNIIHSVVVTAANVADCTVLPELLHGKETRVWGDSAYRGQRDAIRARAPLAQDFINRPARRGGVVNAAIAAVNHTKSRVRSRVEHTFSVIKGVFGFRKTRYRGLKKNGQAFVARCALANLFRFRHKIWFKGSIRPDDLGNRSIRRRTSKSDPLLPKNRREFAERPLRAPINQRIPRHGNTRGHEHGSLLGLSAARQEDAHEAGRATRLHGLLHHRRL